MRGLVRLSLCTNTACPSGQVDLAAQQVACFRIPDAKLLEMFQVDDGSAIVLTVVVAVEPRAETEWFISQRLGEKSEFAICSFLHGELAFQRGELKCL